MPGVNCMVYCVYKNSVIFSSGKILLSFLFVLFKYLSFSSLYQGSIGVKKAVSYSLYQVNYGFCISHIKLISYHFRTACICSFIRKFPQLWHVAQMLCLYQNLFLFPGEP